MDPFAEGFAPRGEKASSMKHVAVPFERRTGSSRLPLQLPDPSILLDRDVGMPSPSPASQRAVDDLQREANEARANIMQLERELGLCGDGAGAEARAGAVPSHTPRNTRVPSPGGRGGGGGGAGREGGEGGGTRGRLHAAASRQSQHIEESPAPQSESSDRNNYMKSWLGKLSSPDVSPTKISHTGDRKQRKQMMALDRGPRIPTPPGSPPLGSARGVLPRATSTSSKGSRSPTLQERSPPSVAYGMKGHGSDVQEKREGMTPLQQRLADLSRRIESVAAQAGESGAPAKVSLRLAMARAAMIGNATGNTSAAMTSFKTVVSADTRTTFNISMGDGDDSPRGSEDLDPERFTPQSFFSQSFENFVNPQSENAEKTQRRGDKVEGKSESMAQIVEESVINASMIKHTVDARDARGDGSGSPSNDQATSLAERTDGGGVASTEQTGMLDGKWQRGSTGAVSSPLRQNGDEEDGEAWEQSLDSILDQKAVVEVVDPGTDCLSPQTDPASSMGETDNSFLTIDPLVLDENAPNVRADNAGSNKRMCNQDSLSQGGSVTDSSEDDIMESNQEVRLVLENIKEDDREMLCQGASAGPHSASADDIEALRQELQFLNAASAETGANAQAAEANDGSPKMSFEERYPIFATRSGFKSLDSTDGSLLQNSLPALGTSPGGTPYASWSEGRRSVPNEKPPKMGFSPTSKAGRARSLCPQDPGALQCGIGAALNKNSVGVVFVQQLTKNGSAARSGQVQVGDIVLTIDGIAVSKSTLDEIALLVLGDEGSSVALVLRRGNQVFPAFLKREPLEMEKGNLSSSTQQQHQHLYQQQFMGKEHTAELIRQQVSSAVPARSPSLGSLTLPFHESHHSPRILSATPARTPSLGSLKVTGQESRNAKHPTASSPRGAAMGPGLLGPFSTPQQVSQAHSFSPIVKALPGGGYSAVPPLHFLHSPSPLVSGSPANSRPPSVLYMSNGPPLSPRAQINGVPFGQPASPRRINGVRIQVSGVPGSQPGSPRPPITGRPYSQPGSLRAHVNGGPGSQPGSPRPQMNGVPGSPRPQMNGVPGSPRLQMNGVPGSPRPQMNGVPGSPRPQSNAKPIKANQTKAEGTAPRIFQVAPGWDFMSKPGGAGSTAQSPSNRVVHAEFL